MRKKIVRLTLMLLLFLLSIFFCACVNNETERSSEVTLTSFSVVESTIPTSAIKGNVDITQIQIELVYSDGKKERMTIDSSMLDAASLEKLNVVGTHTFTVIYKKKMAEFQMAIYDEEPVYYSLRIYGGVPTFVNGQKLPNRVQLSGEYYENVYLDGTVVTIEWIDDGNNFSYWTANDLQVSTESIVNVTVDGNLIYRPYSAPSVSTVAFKTFCSAVLQSITTNVLYESDIASVYRDNYIFAGWTTDEITEAQSLNGYSRNKVSFPYSVGRNITFYATWIPMGVEYTLVGEGDDKHYEVTGYVGTASSLILPEKYAGLDVTAIRADAFLGDNVSSLRFITLSSSIATVEGGAFRKCFHLENIFVEEDTHFTSIGGVLYSADGRELVAYPANKVCALFTVPDTTKRIYPYAFADAVVGAIKLSPSVEWLGARCFDSVYIDNVDFTNVNPVGFSSENDVFNKQLDTILFAQSAVERFRSFPVFAEEQQRIVVSRSDVHDVYVSQYEEGDGQIVSVLYRVIYDKNLVEGYSESDPESYATAEMIGLSRGATTFAIPIRLSQPGGKSYNVCSLADYAMKGCTYLTNVVISFSSHLARVGEEVFTDTPWLKNKNTDVLQANDIIFKYFGTRETFVMDTNTKKIAEGAFKGNTYLKYVDVRANVSLKTIAPYAFTSCTSLVGFICDPNPDGEGVYLKYMVESIGEYAFYNTAVTSLKLQASSAQLTNRLTSIGDYAFADCKYLTSVALSSSTVDISPCAFTHCVSLQRFVMEEISSNPVFEAYEGILYSRVDNKYAVFCYPAGRIDGEFDPAVVRSYGYWLEYDLSEYVGNEDVSVGSIYYNGKKQDLFLTIVTNEKWKVNYDTIHSTYTLLFVDDEQELKPSVIIDKQKDGSYVASGDYYYSIKIGDVRVPLLYDPERDSYYYYPTTKYYVETLSVTNSLYDTLDETSGTETEVGTFTVQEKTFSLYVKIQDGILIRSGRNHVPVNEESDSPLKQTTTAFYDEDGNLDESSIDGEFYFYFYLSDLNNQKTVLIYDQATGAYYFEGGLNVVEIGKNAFSYSSVAAIKISSLIRTIGENAFDSPGLLYLKFDSNPVSFTYNVIVGEFEPSYVFMSENVSYPDKIRFFGSFSDSMNDFITYVPYRFVFADDDKDILYAINENDSNMYIIRVSRIVEYVIVPEFVNSDGIKYEQVKKVLPYAFFGSFIRGVTLRGVNSLASNAFSQAEFLTKLYIETDFISDVQPDTFGATFHNGMYIYDSQNGFNLYKGSNWVPEGTLFTYKDAYGAEQNSCPYLILTDSQEPFAVITYVNDLGQKITVDILYGEVTAANVAEIQKKIARTGYDISGWTDASGHSISGGVDYNIPYNQELMCEWSAQKYTVFFVVNEGEVKKIVDGTPQTLPAKGNPTTGSVTYQSSVSYDEDFLFALYNYDNNRYTFSCWKDSDETRYGSATTLTKWDTVLEDRVIYLYPVMTVKTYRLIYVVDSDVTISVTDTVLTYGANNFELAVPTCENYSFLGWYFYDSNGVKVILTDGRGRSRISWMYTEDSYNLYALWNTVFVYPNGDDVSVKYGDNYTLKTTDCGLPSNFDFTGWYIVKNGRYVKITDESGRGLSPWTFDGKEEYFLEYIGGEAE